MDRVSRLSFHCSGAISPHELKASTATGDITVDRRLVPSHYLFDFNAGYRRKIGRYHPSFQLNVANVADDDDFYGAVWQTGRTYRLSIGANF